MMKRIVSVLFFLSLFLAGVGLVAPGFIDWNPHKDKILAQVSPYLQRRIDVAGNISFKIIPQPEIVLETVTISNIEGAKSGPFMALKRLKIRIGLAPLLEGRVEVEDINLVEPVLNLEVLEDGRATSWAAILKGKPPVVSGIAPSAVRLNRVTVTNGTVNYLNRFTGVAGRIENLDFSVAADTLLGPYRVTGGMKHRNLPVKIVLNTGAYDAVAPVPVHISLTPGGEPLPRVTFDGVMDLQSGFDVQGEMTVAQGSLGSLLDVDSLNRFGFMRETAEITCMLKIQEYGKAHLVLSDIKAKFGKEGNLRGGITASFFRPGKPSVDFDLEGDNLAVTDKSDGSYVDVPGAFDGSLQFKGKNILWDGRKLGTADISATFDQKAWTIKSAQVSLPGHSQIRLSGVMTPATDSADYKTVQILTEDLGKLVNALGPDDNSIFRSLSDTGLVKKFTLSSGLLVSPSRISFFNIDAVVGDKAKVSGVLNVDRSASKPNFVAKLHFSDWDPSSFPAAAYEGFLRRIMNSDADMELTAKNYVRNGARIPDMSFKGKIDGQGIDVRELKGSLSDKDAFTVKGRFAALLPVSGMDVSYTLKAGKSADAAKVLGVALPPLLTWENFDIGGEVRGGALKYDFTAKGNAGGGDIALRGTADGGKYAADMTVKKFDLDKWLAGYPSAAPELSLKIRGEELAWQGQNISNPVLTMEATPSSVMIAGLEGEAFGGKLKADMGFIRQEGSRWSSSFKGSLRQADLDLLKKKTGLSVFSLKGGDVDFDLKSPKNTLSTLAGGIGVRTDTLIVERFNFDKLGDAVRLLTGVPENLQQVIDDIFRKNGATVYRDVYGSFRIDDGRFIIETLKLPGARGDMSVTGSADVKTGKYDVSGDLHLNQPEDFPLLKVRRTSEMPDYTVDGKPVGKFILKRNPAPPPASALSPPPDKNAIKGILNRLDEEDKPSGPEDKKESPAPSPQPSPDLRWDVEKIMQEMQMLEMMPRDAGTAPPMP
ncbi:MAG: AsmA family protein [Pseudomonadota bacterium]